MSRILCAWELGGGAGHLNNLKVIGGALRSRGHEVGFALKDLAPASRHFDLSDTTLMQAPVWSRRSRLPPSLSYPELLNRIGYLNADHLAALLSGWCELLRMVKPDLLIADHSPTALLAARLEGVRRVTVGTGFESPPRGAPMPTIQPWQNALPERLAESEAAVLGRINQALSSRGAAPLDAVSDIFDLDETFLCTLPEFDHYSSARGEAEYWGPLSAPGAGGEIPWPAGDGDRIFVYYRVGYPRFAAMIGQIAALGMPTLVVADDASPSVIQKLSTEKLHIVTTPVDLKAVAETAKVAVCHGGHGSVMNLLLGGCPLMIMPVVVEQALMAYRMNRAGTALVVSLQRGKQADYAAPVRRILETPEFADRARAMSQNHASLDPARQIERIADRCDAILSQA